MTTPADPPLVRERAGIRQLRSRGTFQFVFGGAFGVLAVVAAVRGATWWAVAVCVLAAALVAASGVVAWRIAAARLARFEAEHGAGAGLRGQRRTPDAGARQDRDGDRPTDADERPADEGGPSGA